ncbi:hypothetical protein WA577_007264, partial [Blastocystis sp. JDR]
MEVQYRLATHDDIEPIRHLIIETLRVSSSMHYSKTIIDDQIAKQTRECFEDLIANYACICAFINEQIVGVGCVTDKELKRVFVLPQFQGQHIGSAIVRQLMALHAERYPSNCLELYATVDGKHMYERLGFSVFREFHDE